MVGRRCRAAATIIVSRCQIVTGHGSTTRAPFGSRANAATRCVISAASRPPAGISRTPNDGAAASIVRRYAAHVGLAASKTTAILSTLGAHSLSSCSHFPPTENSKLVKPVILPSGRARFVTTPAETGSTTCGGGSERAGGKHHVGAQFN